MVRIAHLRRSSIFLDASSSSSLLAPPSSQFSFAAPTTTTMIEMLVQRKIVAAKTGASSARSDGDENGKSKLPRSFQSVVVRAVGSCSIESL